MMKRLTLTILLLFGTMAVSFSQETDKTSDGSEKKGIAGFVRNVFTPKNKEESKASEAVEKTDTEISPAGRQYSLSDLAPTLDKESGKWGFMQFGEWVIKPRFDAAGDFADGLAAVSLGGKWGYVGKSGSSVIPFKFEQAGVFVDGLARVKLYDKWGFIDKNGTTVVPFKYAMASDFSDGLAKVNFGGETGYIDKTGEWFDSAEDMMQSFSAFARHFVDYKKLSGEKNNIKRRNR